MASFCYEAGIEPDALLAELASKPEISLLADPERLNYEAYPLTMAVFRNFRASRRYRREILDKLALGSDTMLDLGNLYTAALPAWIAAGFEQAADENRLTAGEEILTLGYGSGDAAEVIPFIVAENWREATAAIVGRSRKLARLPRGLTSRRRVVMISNLNRHASSLTSSLTERLCSSIRSHTAARFARRRHDPFGFQRS